MKWNFGNDKWNNCFNYEHSTIISIKNYFQGIKHEIGYSNFGVQLQV